MFAGVCWCYQNSGRWEDSLTRDSNGHIFLDYDDELITIIVNFLRMKTVEGPSDLILYPYVNPHKKKEFRRLLRYFGLLDFFELDPLLDFSKDSFVQRDDLIGSTITMTEHDNNKKITFGYKNEGRQDHHGVTCSTELDSSGEGSFWKLRIDKLSDDGNFFLMGITGNLDSLALGYTDSTFFGWGPGERWSRGSGEDGVAEWSRSQFAQGDCFFLRLKAKQLSIHRVDENDTIAVIDNIDTDTTKFYISFIFYNDGTVASLESLNAEERAVFTDND